MAAPSSLTVWYRCQTKEETDPTSSLYRADPNHMVADLVNWLCDDVEGRPFKGTIPSKLEVLLFKANFTGEKTPEFDEALDPGLQLVNFQTTSKTPLLVKGPASVAVSFDKDRFRANGVKFYGLEPNGGGIQTIERSTLLDDIRAISIRLYRREESTEKFPVFSIVTSRGMGKTFLLKKAVLDRSVQTPYIQEACQNGRVISVEGGSLSSAISLLLLRFSKSESREADEERHIRALDLFWPTVILWHLHQVFAGATIGKYHFTRPCGGLVDAVKLLDDFPACTDSKLAFQLLIEVTNIAFGNETQPTVLLLDEVAYLVKEVPMTTQSSHPHTVLSWVLHLLATQVRSCFISPLCLCAGTTDGDLVLISERTSVVPRPLLLTVFTMRGVFEFGKQYCSKVLSMADIWPKSLRELEKDNLLLTIINYSCQVPRLLKFGIDIWARNRDLAFTSVLDLFYKEAKLYYSEAAGAIKLKGFAYLLLACNVRLPPNSQPKHQPTVPGTNLEWEDLVKKSIVFPYYLSQNRRSVLPQPESYYFPPLFWIDLANDRLNNNISTSDREDWVRVTTEISQIVPGLNPAHLVVDLASWVAKMPSLLLLGQIWENLVASSLVVKCKLLMIQYGVEKVPFNLVNPLERGSQAANLIDQYQLSLSRIEILEKETTADSEVLRDTLYMNTKIQTAHWDAVVGATPHRLFLQDKFTLKAPFSAEIVRQLPQDRDRGLLWFFPGYDEDSVEAPRDFKSDPLKDAINTGRIAFLSGAGFINPLTLDVVILLKKALLDAIALQ